MRVKTGSVKLLERAGILHPHAVILQGQETQLTGFSTPQMIECVFSYRLLGASFQPDDTFTYLIPRDALEQKGSEGL